MTPLDGLLFYSLVVGGDVQAKQWLDSGFASCGTYEYSTDGWSLVMPPDDSFLPNPVSVREVLPADIVSKLD
jgi:hypothetical protein